MQRELDSLKAVQKYFLKSKLFIGMDKEPYCPMLELMDATIVVELHTKGPRYEIVCSARRLEMNVSTSKVILFVSPRVRWLIIVGFDLTFPLPFALDARAAVG